MRYLVGENAVKCKIQILDSTYEIRNTLNSEILKFVRHIHVYAANAAVYNIRNSFGKQPDISAERLELSQIRHFPGCGLFKTRLHLLESVLIQPNASLKKGSNGVKNSPRQN